MEKSNFFSFQKRKISLFINVNYLILLIPLLSVFQTLQVYPQKYVKNVVEIWGVKLASEHYKQESHVLELKEFYTTSS